MKHIAAVVILGGGLTQISEGRWRTTTFEDPGDDFGILGDRLRVDAAYYLYRDNPESILIVSGGKGQLANILDAQSVAEVIKNELIELGIPENCIVTESESDNTFQQLIAIAHIIEQKNFSEATLLTNRFHVERVKTMVEMNQDLKQIFDQKNIQYLSAEEILLEHDRKRWHEMIEQAYESEAMQKRIKLEEKGIRELREGKYKLT